MKIYDGEMSQDQIDAGLKAMKGRFKGSKVMSALAQAAVTSSVSGSGTRFLAGYRFQISADFCAIPRNSPDFTFGIRLTQARVLDSALLERIPRYS